MSGNSSQPVYSASLFNEYTIALEGSYLSCILYGVYVITAVTNLSLLRKRRYRVLLSFTALQLVITTLYIAVALYASPAQSLGSFGIYGSYSFDALSPWPSVLVDAAFVLNTWTSDGFLLYRCYVICMGNKFALAFAAALYLATFGSSLAWVVFSAMPGAVYSSHSVQVAGTWYWSFSAAMNISVSIIIAGRLWMHRQAIARAIGAPHGGFYFGYMAMTLESALLYTVFVIAALIAFTFNSPLQNLFFPVLGIVQVIAPSVIVYRIARGISFETDEYGSVASGSLRFASSTRPKTLLRPIRQEMLNGSDTTHNSQEHDRKSDRDGSDLFHEVKENV